MVVKLGWLLLLGGFLLWWTAPLLSPFVLGLPVLLGFFLLVKDIRSNGIIALSTLAFVAVCFGMTMLVRMMR